MATTTKPRFTITATTVRIVFSDGRVAQLHLVEGNDWSGLVTEVNGKTHQVHAYGRDHAVRSAYCLGVQAPDALALVDAQATADAAETQGSTQVTKLLRQLLRARTGRSWSVRQSRGSGWLHISCPPSRSTSRFGYLTHEDQATLSSIFGECSHQGISIRTERGVRAYYACRAAGLALPKGVTVAAPAWD